MTTTVHVEIDESKFTPEFINDFKDTMYPLGTIEDHVEHIARLAANGYITGFFNDFIEGYGNIKEFGIIADTIDSDSEITIRFDDNDE